MSGFGEQHKSKKKRKKSTKSSKEQLINQAIKFHIAGNISEAEELYRYLIKQGCNDQRVWSNYGVILKDHGKLSEAESSYRKAIELNPDFAIAHSNLGGILHDLGKLQEAEISTRKAIELNPDYTEAHSNLGTILHDLGKLQEAEICERNAIKLQPDFTNAYYNIGNIFKDLGKSQDAFESYLKVIEINPRHSNVHLALTRFLRDSDPSLFDNLKLKKVLNALLEKNDLPHQELFNTFKFLYSDEMINILENLDSDFSRLELLIKNKVIINALKKIIFYDPKFETVLTNARKKICYRIANNIDTVNELQFIIALGEQCFLNEYVYSFTEEEKISVERILKKCRDGELNEINISILSCYSPLYKLLDQITSLKCFNSSNQSFHELIELQNTEPKKEIELSKRIKRLGTINDDISRKVKSQYEQNPYPRWRYGNAAIEKKIPVTLSINHSIEPNSISHNMDNKQLKVLIAGCGTGQHILHTQQYMNAQIIGIDLSSSSLAYTQRKIDELEIDNVELIQMDILEVDLLEEKFDIIESSGVLHHMSNPSKGLSKLLGILKDNGFLKLGLYSELARRDIIKARNYISSQAIKTNEDNIRKFRDTVFSGEIPTLNSLTKSSDFYTLSSCRDLCFHAQEHRFTINQLHQILKSNHLEFLGFVLPKEVKYTYKQHFPQDTKQINLQNWEEFEEQYPNTFAGMYQFWVAKL